MVASKSEMKIGIDAKWFFVGNPSGRVVIRNLLENLIRINSKHELFIILNKNQRTKSFPFHNSKVKLIYLWGNNNLLSNIFVVPFVLYKYKLDICLFQYFSPLFANFKRISFIHDVIFKSNPKYFTLIQKMYLYPMKYLSKKSDGIVTVSRYQKTQIQYYGFNGNNIPVGIVYNGVNSAFMPRHFHRKESLDELISKYNLPDKFLLYVGRINERKNIINLLNALNYLKNKSIILVICGKQEGKSYDIYEKINEMKLTNRVLVLGHIDDTELPLLYSLASVFCYISYIEGFGLPPLEALASGIPVVVSDTEIFHEVYGNAGVYCDPNEPLNIAEKIDYLLDSKEIQNSKIELGLQISKSFSWDKSARTLIQFLEKF